MELLYPPKIKFASIIAGASFVDARQPIESLPCVTSMRSVISRGVSGAFFFSAMTGGTTRPR